MRKIFNDAEAFAAPWKIKVSRRTVREAEAWLRPFTQAYRKGLQDELEAALDAHAKALGYRRLRCLVGNAMAQFLWRPARRNAKANMPPMCDAQVLGSREFAKS